MLNSWNACSKVNNLLSSINLWHQNYSLRIYQKCSAAEAIAFRSKHRHFASGCMSSKHNPLIFTLIYLSLRVDINTWIYCISHLLFEEREWLFIILRKEVQLHLAQVPRIIKFTDQKELSAVLDAHDYYHHVIYICAFLLINAVQCYTFMVL